MTWKVKNDIPTGSTILSTLKRSVPARALPTAPKTLNTCRSAPKTVLMKSVKK